MSQLGMPDGFRVGHWTDREAATGSTVVLPPSGTVAAVDVRGGGPGTRETDVIGLLAGVGQAHGLLLTGGSAFGLAAVDGVMRWLEERGVGHPTSGGCVPIVPAAVVFDLTSGDGKRRPGPDEGYAACDAAVEGIPPVGSVGAGTGACVGKLYGRERAVKAGVGYAVCDLAQGQRLSVLAVVNAFGDVIGSDGTVMAGARGDDGKFVGITRVIRSRLLESEAGSELSTVLICVATDAGLDRRGCGYVCKMAHAGLARAVDPAYTEFDGDTVFCLAGGKADDVRLSIIGAVAADLVTEAIRDAISKAESVAGVPALKDVGSPR